jgi:hypothetical protein
MQLQDMILQDATSLNPAKRLAPPTVIVQREGEGQDCRQEVPR